MSGLGRPTGRGSLRYRVITVLAALAVVAGCLAPLFADPSAKDRIATDPQPELFDDATIAPLGRQIDDQGAQAQRFMYQWWAQHDTAAHDEDFVRWLEDTLPAPPTASQRSPELAAVAALAPERTAAGVTAATWLEVHGKKDVWKLYAHDLGEITPADAADELRGDVKDMLSMAKTVANDLGTTYQQSAPYVLDPSLRPDHDVAPGQVCPCSYPSSHAADSAAARTYLAALAPQRAAEYRWMEDEVAYSRMYMAGHVVSDITAGTLLGDMIGEYFLVTRTDAPPPPLPPVAR